jgi:hypothetical protein
MFVSVPREWPFLNSVLGPIGSAVIRIEVACSFSQVEIRIHTKSLKS